MRSLLYASQYVLFHITVSCTIVSSEVYHRRVNITGILDATISGMKRVGSEINIKDTFPCTTLPVLHHYHGLLIFGMCNGPV